VRERVYGPPDLVVEVLSPRPRIGAIDERVRWCAQYGVREIWLYDQTRRRLRVLGCRGAEVATVTELAAADTLASAVLPRLTPPVSALVV